MFFIKLEVVTPGKAATGHECWMTAALPNRILMGHYIHFYLPCLGLVRPAWCLWGIGLRKREAMVAFDLFCERTITSLISDCSSWFVFFYYDSQWNFSVLLSFPFLFFLSLDSQCTRMFSVRPQSEFNQSSLLCRHLSWLWGRGGGGLKPTWRKSGISWDEAG